MSRDIVRSQAVLASQGQRPGELAGDPAQDNAHRQNCLARDVSNARTGQPDAALHQHPELPELHGTCPCPAVCRSAHAAELLRAAQQSRECPFSCPPTLTTPISSGAGRLARPSPDSRTALAGLGESNCALMHRAWPEAESCQGRGGPRHSC